MLEEKRRLEEDAKTDDAVIECLLNKIEVLELDALKARYRFLCFVDEINEEFEMLCEEFEAANYFT